MCLTLFSTILLVLLRSKQISLEADSVATNDNEDKLEGLVSGSRHQYAIAIRYV